MKYQTRKNKFAVYLALSLLIFFALPVTNIYVSGLPKRLSKDTITRRLFSFDIIDAKINYMLYLIGLSGDAGQVIVGQEGWLYLGDNYLQAMSRGRDLAPVPKALINKWATSMRTRQDWLKEQGVPMVFAIAPNKYSIYPEYLPKGFLIPKTNSTDRLVTTAKDAGVNLIDLRTELVKKKMHYDYLYNRTDTHWTTLGAYFGYRTLMIEIQHLFEGIRFITFNQLRHKPKVRPACCMARILKIKDSLDSKHDQGHRVYFPGMDDKICIKILNKTNNSEGKCKVVRNKEIKINTVSAFVSNSNALNKLSVLLLRDSFGTVPGPFINTSFEKTWNIHYNKMSNDYLFRQFIKKKQPDLVIFLVVERALFNKSFHEFG